jgi:hypothetical protein
MKKIKKLKKKKEDFNIWLNQSFVINLLKFYVVEKKFCFI